MLGATLLIFILFAFYNFAQYLVLQQWMLKQEKNAVRVTMTQIQEYLLDKSRTPDAVHSSETEAYLNNMIDNNQMLRIIDPSGKVQVVIANQFDADWVPPEVVHQPQLVEMSRNEDHILVYSSPAATLGTIEIASNLETFDHFSKALLWVMVTCGILAVGISALSGLTIAKQFMQPIRALAAAIRNVQQKGLRERVVVIENGDELSSLAKLFNDLMNQLERSFMKQKQFVEDASHELRTPITILEGHLSLLNRWGKNDPAVLQESLEASLLEVRRLKGVVQELLTLTRVETQPVQEMLEPTPLEPLLMQTIKRVEILHSDFTFTMDTNNLADVMVTINPLQLEQVLLILLDNAVKYSVDDKRIRLGARHEDHVVFISIADHGIGIPEEDLPHIFDRFYRVDKARSREIGGTGLGLSIAKQIVNNYQGELQIDSKEDCGTKVTIRFPLAP